MGDQQKRWKNFKREGLSYSGNTESELTESCQRARKGNRVCGNLIARKQEPITQTVDRNRQICNFSTFTFLLIVENRKIHFWDTKASFCRITSANAKKKKSLILKQYLTRGLYTFLDKWPFYTQTVQVKQLDTRFFGKTR